MLCKGEKPVLIRRPNIHYPICRNTEPKQLLIRNIDKWESLALRRVARFDVPWDNNLLDGLPYLHHLRRACLWVRFKAPPLRPLICLVVMIDVTRQSAADCLVNNK